MSSLKTIAKRFGPIHRKDVFLNKVLSESYDRLVQIIPFDVIIS